MNMRPVAADLADMHRSTNLSAAEPFLSVESSSSPTVGDVLRSERLVRDLSLAISRSNCVSRPLIFRAGRGRWDSLPGRTYAAGYVRSYDTLMISIQTD